MSFEFWKFLQWFLLYSVMLLNNPAKDKKNKHKALTIKWKVNVCTKQQTVSGIRKKKDDEWKFILKFNPLSTTQRGLVGFIQADEGESSNHNSGVENDTALLQCELELPDNTLIIDKDWPKYVFVRLRKNEYDLAYQCCTKGLQWNNRVWTPVQNIIRVGLLGLTLPARRIEQTTTKLDVWNLQFEQAVTDKIMTNTNNWGP